MTLVLPDGFQYLAASMVSLAWLIIWQITRIYPARKAAGIEYPQMYAENFQLKDNPAAIRFNCVQRCHQNTLENVPILFIGALVTGLKHPCLAATAIFVWVLTRIAYTIGYSTGVPKQRGPGAIGGTVVLFGLLIAATVTTVQLCCL